MYKIDFSYWLTEKIKRIKNIVMNKSHLQCFKSIKIYLFLSLELNWTVSMCNTYKMCGTNWREPKWFNEAHGSRKRAPINPICTKRRPCNKNVKAHIFYIGIPPVIQWRQWTQWTQRYNIRHRTLFSLCNFK